MADIDFGDFYDLLDNEDRSEDRENLMDEEAEDVDVDADADVPEASAEARENFRNKWKFPDAEHFDILCRLLSEPAGQTSEDTKKYKHVKSRFHKDYVLVTERGVRMVKCLKVMKTV